MKGTVAWAFAAAMVLGASPAAAQVPGSSDTVSRLTACRGIADPAARLACYDSAAAAVAQAIASKDVVVLDREQVKETRRSLFGFSLPKLPALGGGNDDTPEEREFTGKVAGASMIGYDKWRIRLENGAVWETTEALNDQVRTGDEVRIRKAAFGSYFLSVKGRRSARAKRVG